MGQPKTLEAFGEVKTLMDRALQEDITVECPNPGSAVALRHSIYAARTRDRKQTERIYEEDDPLYGRSPYDKLTILLDETKLTLTKHRLSAGGFKIKSTESGKDIKL
jgi:hypothetical protein